MAKGFTPQHTDYELSPCTGMDRESWLEAACYLMEGFFAGIAGPEDPPLCCRTETEVTYPHRKAPAAQQAREEKAEVFEGLTRSLFLAAVLIRNDPEMAVPRQKNTTAAAAGRHGTLPQGKEQNADGASRAESDFLLRDYYAHWILKVVTPGDPWYVGSYEEMQAMCSTPDPFRTFQQTVETCALVIGLQICEEAIWNRYTKEEQDRIAVFLSDWAGSSTVPQNWRLFNMLDLAFLSMHGYPIPEQVMYEHAAAILEYYVGDGWYRDGQSFDFYSCWAFNVYAPLWCRWYGYEHAPAVAARFEEHSNALMKTYADFFDRDGWTLLWGRSSIYRNAATSAFDGNLFLRHPTVDPGRARRIASGSLLQFLERDDLLVNGVPSIGFYGPFVPLVQPYSCAESVYWLGKAFLCLALPADHPFWTAKEKNGPWGTPGAKTVRETVLDGPGLCFSNHDSDGSTILRSGKVVKTAGDRNGRWEYGKLCYSTKYPWEADGAQEYVLTEPDGQQRFGNVTLWGGRRNGVLYRRRYYDWRPETELHWTEGINLADWPVPGGILRCDQLRLLQKPVTITLGSFGFPDNGTTVSRRSGTGAEAVILQGRDHMGRQRAMAMTIWTGSPADRNPETAGEETGTQLHGGWSSLRVEHSTGTNPDSPASLIVYADLELQHHYDAAEPHLLLSQVITKETAEDFTEEELFPIADVETEDPFHTGSCGEITVRMKDGSVKRVCFEGMEADLSV